MAGPSDRGMTSFASLSGGETDDDGALLKNPSSSGAVEQSDAEKAREKKLRDDPMADVLGPLFVDCRNCGKRIKLSSKSSYDTFHWRTHRERCLKKQRAQKQRARTQKSSPPSRHSSLGALERPKSPIVTPPNHESLSEPHQIASGSHDKLPTFTPNPSAPKTLVRPSSDFEEYLRLSHRRQVRPMRPGPSGHWQDWSWSQLVPPKFMTGNSPGDDEPNTHQKIPDTRLYDDAMNTSMLSRSA
ncbi:hypothetical protein BD779DRAFT_100658 [Infundibulicybe gibba]|nr:hypothetical protein BD779DRAFT_100658 [Infundibulicybe gibba]